MRSDFLLYWTGKNLHGPPRTLADLRELPVAIADAYRRRAIDILEHGFWMTRPREELLGRDGSSLGYSAAVTCFTEVRLSETFELARRYGLLGIGVDRLYVLDRFGGPVHYVRNHQSETVVAKASLVGDTLRRLVDDGLVAREVLAAYSGWRSFLKAMSHPGVDDFAYLEEHEWRVVHSREQQAAGRIRGTDGVDDEAEYRLALAPDDVRLIVFPNDAVRMATVHDAAFRAWQVARRHPPVLLTIAECLQF